jgi:hypothetical protein
MKTFISLSLDQITFILSFGLSSIRQNIRKMKFRVFVGVFIIAVNLNSGKVRNCENQQSFKLFSQQHSALTGLTVKLNQGFTVQKIGAKLT